MSERQRAVEIRSRFLNNEDPFEELNFSHFSRPRVLGIARVGLRENKVAHTRLLNPSRDRY